MLLVLGLIVASRVLLVEAVLFKLSHVVGGRGLLLLFDVSASNVIVGGGGFLSLLFRFLVADG